MVLMNIFLSPLWSKSDIFGEVAPKRGEDAHEIFVSPQACLKRDGFLSGLLRNEIRRNISQGLHTQWVAVVQPRLVDWIVCPYGNPARQPSNVVSPLD